VPSDTERVFVAGAAGAIGRVLCHLLVADGHFVAGTTRSAAKVEFLRGLGVEPVLVDVFDAAALRQALLDARPTIVIHQLTDLPQTRTPEAMSAAFARNARLREVGTRNLVEAAIAGGVARMIVQSVAFAYAPGPQPYDETCPLNVASTDPNAATTARGVASLEQQVLKAPFDGVVLRYGRLYGPGTWFTAAPPLGTAVHVEAAADAARRAVSQGQAGIYNVAEEDGTVSCAKAHRELGWDPGFRIARTQS
jgi:nucleoside-diphosphate-sugar epimerase